MKKRAMFQFVWSLWALDTDMCFETVPGGECQGSSEWERFVVCRSKFSVLPREEEAPHLSAYRHERGYAINTRRTFVSDTL